MDNENEKELDINMELIMQQLHEASTQDAPPAESGDFPPEPEAAEVTLAVETETISEGSQDETILSEADSDFAAQVSQVFSQAAVDVPASDASGVSDDTSPLPQIPQVPTDENTNEGTEPAAADAAPREPAAADEANVPPAPEAPQPQPGSSAAPEGAGYNTVTLSRSERLRELKRKIVAGPEKRYYALSEQGVGKLQVAMILNLIILMLCGFGIFLHARGLVPASRNKLMVYSQVLAMMVSGLLGIGLIMDGIQDLFRLRYSLNTTLAITFIACMADAWFSLDEQRVPFCAAFVLEMAMAMLARYHSRSTELAQLDTMRKATSLTSLVKEPQFYAKRAGILRGQGDVDDFMDTYSRASGPEITQQVYAFVSLLCCIGIAALTWMLHGPSMAMKIFSTSLLVSVPAGYFVALSRPAYLLEKRLHMVGAVICGWQGVKKLCGRAVVPLREKDLFPRGATKLNGIKYYSDRPNTEVVSYAASMIFAAGGGLVPLMRNLMKDRGGTEYQVEAFQDYGQGSIGGEIGGESVLLGSSSFLESMGVEIPQGTMVNQALYVAIDGVLCAVIAISYSKMHSAAAGIVSLCGCRKLKTLLLTGDFMITDSFVREKFSIRTKRLVLPTAEERAELAAKRADPDADVLALLTQDDLISTAYTITGSMALRRAYRVGTFIGILGGIVGILTMLALSYLGATELLTPARVILYQLAWMIPSFLASEWTRIV